MVLVLEAHAGPRREANARQRQVGLEYVVDVDAFLARALDHLYGTAGAGSERSANVWTGNRHVRARESINMARH